MPENTRPAASQLVAVAVVDLVAVPVPLLDPGGAVGLRGQRARGQLGGVEAQAHRAAQVAGALDEGLLLLHGRDHRLGHVGIELGRRRLLETGLAAGVLDHHALQAQAQTQGRDLVRPGVGERTELALDAADPEAARDDDRVDVLEVVPGTGRRLALVGGDPADVDLGLVGEATGAEGLADRQVGVGQVDVLADQADRDLLGGVVHPPQQVVPAGPVDVAEGQVEPADEVGVEPLAVQDLGDVVDRRRVGGGDHRLLVDVAHQRDLALDAGRDVPVGAAHDRVGLDADRAQRRDGVLGGLGLQLARRADVGHQRDVQEEAVVAADVVAHLAGGLEERQRLDVADGAADLGDHDVDSGPPMARIRSLISLVMCGITWTVSPR